MAPLPHALSFAEGANDERDSSVPLGWRCQGRGGVCPVPLPPRCSGEKREESASSTDLELEKMQTTVRDAPV